MPLRSWSRAHPDPLGCLLQLRAAERGVRKTLGVDLGEERGDGKGDAEVLEDDQALRRLQPARRGPRWARADPCWRSPGVPSPGPEVLVAVPGPEGVAVGVISSVREGRSVMVGVDVSDVTVVQPPRASAVSTTVAPTAPRRAIPRMA